MSQLHLSQPIRWPPPPTPLQAPNFHHVRGHYRSTLIDTGSIPASGLRLGGVEAGLDWRRLWLLGGAYRFVVDRSGGHGGTLGFSGWYVQGSYTLLGTPRQWQASHASWGAPSPAHGFDPAHGDWGAVEVGARYSELDLSDGNIRGGRQQVWTAGGSWYPIDRLRLMLQYQYGHVTDAATPRDFQAVAMRAQVYF